MVMESINTWFEESSEIYGTRKALSFFRGQKVETQLTYFDLQKDISLFVNFLTTYDL